jgi:hypothetical protein
MEFIDYTSLLQQRELRQGSHALGGESAFLRPSLLLLVDFSFM